MLGGFGGFQQGCRGRVAHLVPLVPPEGDAPGVLHVVADQGVAAGVLQRLLDVGRLVADDVDDQLGPLQLPQLLIRRLHLGTGGSRGSTGTPKKPGEGSGPQSVNNRHTPPHPPPKSLVGPSGVKGGSSSFKKHLEERHEASLKAPDLHPHPPTPRGTPKKGWRHQRTMRRTLGTTRRTLGTTRRHRTQMKVLSLCPHLQIIEGEEGLGLPPLLLDVLDAVAPCLLRVDDDGVHVLAQDLGDGDLVLLLGGLAEVDETPVLGRNRESP